MGELLEQYLTRKQSGHLQEAVAYCMRSGRYRVDCINFAMCNCTRKTSEIPKE